MLDPHFTEMISPISHFPKFMYNIMTCHVIFIILTCISSTGHLTNLDSYTIWVNFEPKERPTLRAIGRLECIYLPNYYNPGNECAFKPGYFFFQFSHTLKVPLFTLISPTSQIPQLIISEFSPQSLLQSESNAKLLLW